MAELTHNYNYISLKVNASYTLSKMSEYLKPQLRTKSGDPVTIGYGSGTAWKDLKRKDPNDQDALDAIVEAIGTAIKLGFNHFDTAEVYTTHSELGRALSELGIAREKLWVTTKYAVASPFIKKRALNVTDFLDYALEDLKTDYIDLLLIHHPFWDEKKENYTLQSLWEEFIRLKSTGKVRYIGISNGRVQDIEKIINIGGPSDRPVVNQIEFHPYLQEQSPGILEYCKKNNILIEGYGGLTPLFRLHDDKGNDIKDHPLQVLLPKLARKYSKSEGQILLRYLLQKSIIPITTSSKRDRIQEAIEIESFQLDPTDVQSIDQEGAKFTFRGFYKGLI